MIVVREDITTIPISEVLEPRDGCPVCRLRDMLEERAVTYITGAAMMEPDVRIETNKQGFCLTHYQMMLQKRNRLGVALILESHLAAVEKRVFGSLPLSGKRGKAAQAEQESCFVCHIVDRNMQRMLQNLCRMWEQDREVRTLFSEQTGLCLPHFSVLAETAAATMGRKAAPEFVKAASELCQKELQGLREDVSHFCRMFDYRNAGENADWGNSKDAVERTVRFLTSRPVK